MAKRNKKSKSNPLSDDEIVTDLTKATALRERIHKSDAGPEMQARADAVLRKAQGGYLSEVVGSSGYAVAQAHRAAEAAHRAACGV